MQCSVNTLKEKNSSLKKENYSLRKEISEILEQHITDKKKLKAILNNLKLILLIKLLIR